MTKKIAIKNGEQNDEKKMAIKWRQNCDKNGNKMAIKMATNGEKNTKKKMIKW